MSFQKTKCDTMLGKAVEAHLRNLGLHTPTTNQLDLPEQTKIEAIEKHMTAVLDILGMDLTDDSLIETPKRVAKMFVLEKFWGLKPENFPKCTTIENKMGYDEMVVEKNIKVMSDCEHHLVVIDGRATVAYIPNKKVLGLSKLNRIVEYFSRRPQVQERLTQQIGEALQFILECEDVAVVISGKHYCVASRGVEDVSSSTTTSFLSGKFRKNPDVRSEFMSLARSCGE